MMKISSKNAHKALLKKSDYLRNKTDGCIFLGKTEYELIDKYGYWLEALSQGHVLPISKNQDHFVMVCKGTSEPSTRFESAWFKYRILSALKDMLSDIPQGKFDAIKSIPRNKRIIDTLISCLRKIESSSDNFSIRSNCQKGIIKLLDHLNTGKSQTRFNITNYGGLHNFGL